MLYAAKCYWPGVTESELQHAAAAAGHEAAGFCGKGRPIRYLGSLLFPADDLVLCIFETPERDLVSDTAARAGIPCERLMVAVWLGWLDDQL
jgi:hypothetical protein